MHGYGHYSRPLPGLAGNPAITSGVMAEGPQGMGRVYTLPEWARWSDKKRVRWIRDNLVREYVQDPRLRWEAARICEEAGAGPRDYPAQAAALLKFVQQQCYYTNEPGESIQSPWRTLQQRTGDCDDLSVLLATLAESIGLGSRFGLLGKGPRGPVRWVEGTWAPWFAKFEHIYVEIGWPALAPRIWASAEPTIRGAPLGYDVGKYGVTMDRHGRITGLGRWPGGAPRGPVAPSGFPAYAGVPNQGFSGAWGAPSAPAGFPGGLTPAAYVPPGEPSPNAEPGFFSTLFSAQFVRDVSLAAIEGIVVAGATYIAMRQFRR